MALDLLTGAGCVVKVKGSGQSAYKISGWPSGKVGAGLITIDDIQPTEADIASPVVAVDDHRAIYRFGSNFGQIQVHGTIYLGSSKGASAAGVLSKVASAFKKIRLSKKKAPTNVSITSGYKCKAYFTGLAFGQSDPNVNKVAYTITGLIAPSK